MVVRTDAPQRGEVIWIADNRPALVLSPDIYNVASGLCLICPITSQAKGLPFEVPIVIAGKKGVVLANQLSSVAWTDCGTTLAVLDSARVEAVRDQLSLFLYQ